MRRHRHNLTAEQHTKLSDYLRRIPALEQIYRFKQRLSYLLLEKGCNQADAANWQADSCARWPACVIAGSRPWWRSAIHSMPGGKKSPPCGASPATTPSPKASTTKWKFSNVRPTDLETSRTTD